MPNRKKNREQINNNYEYKFINLMENRVEKTNNESWDLKIIWFWL